MEKMNGLKTYLDRPAGWTEIRPGLVVFFYYTDRSGDAKKRLIT